MRTDHAAKHKPVIGLTGGIGAGKSLVGRYLQQLGGAVIDADELARQALDDPNVRQQLVDRWGRGVLGEGGRVDRAKLAAMVFEEPEQLRQLERMTHPLVLKARAALHKRHQSDPRVKAIVEDCPLLLEVGLDKQCDAVIFVDAPRFQRLQRLAAGRGWTDQDLTRREKNQLPLDKKVERADYVVVNDVSVAECFAHVRNVFSQILDP